MNPFFKLGTMLTIVAGAAMTISSCSSNEIEPMSASDLAQAKYEQAFIERFGQPAPNQTWGFGKVTKALTRAANPNNNQWFDPNYCNYEEPAAITEFEREYVMDWFKTNTKEAGTTFDFNNYFIQQVGYSNDSYTFVEKVWEKYENGEDVYRNESKTVYSQNQMDWIFANMNAEGTKYDEVNNFNTGSGSIMLMENSETKFGFGFKDSWGTVNNIVSQNYLMAEIEVPGIGKGYYVGLDYQTQKEARNGHSNENYLSADLKPNGKYDDRVLKIVPAKKNTLKGDYRVIAEDLTVSDKGNDFDFNDVVFDIKFDYPAGKTTIILRAAGGTLPLQVGGVEVHGMFGVPVTTMVNTGGVSKDPVPFELEGTFDKDPNKIKVMVQKDGNWIELHAERGRVASKICVGVDYNWCSERQDIATKYPSFAQWVTNTTPSEWWK